MGPGYMPISMIMMRGGRQSNGGRLSNGVHLCVPTFYVDGALFRLDDPPLDPLTSLRNMVRPEIIRGIEIYTPAEAPAQFDRSSITGCGSVVIWTK
jgi:hypothetical protein